MPWQLSQTDVPCVVSSSWCCSRKVHAASRVPCPMSYWSNLDASTKAPTNARLQKVQARSCMKPGEVQVSKVLRLNILQDTPWTTSKPCKV